MIFLLVCGAGLVGLYAFMHGMGGAIVAIGVNEYEEGARVSAPSEPQVVVIETSYRVLN